MKRIFTLLLLFLLLGCSGSKSMYKRGEKLREAGMMEEATSYYMDALRRKNTNVDAQIALRQIGQQVLDDKLARFYQAYAARQPKEAVYAYREAKEYYELVRRHSVNLSFPPYYAENYAEMEDTYLTELYSSAQQDLDKELFASAQAKLDEIRKLRPDYREAGDLNQYARQEPRYREALAAYDNREFRKAYYIFKDIQDNGGYKESADYLNLCRESAQYTIGLLKIGNSSTLKGWEKAFGAAIVREIMDSGDPFLRMIDRSSTDLLLEEQKLSMTGQVDPGTAAKAGELLGAKALLKAEVIRAEQLEGRLVREKRTGFFGKPVKKKDPTTGEMTTTVQYSRVYYEEYRQENRASCTFQYQLISAETGEILVSDVVEISASDLMEYAKYDGDTRYLYSGTWNDRSPALDKINLAYRDKRELDQKLSAPRRIRTVQSLADDVVKKISNRVALKILAYQPTEG